MRHTYGLNGYVGMCAGFNLFFILQMDKLNAAHVFLLRHCLNFKQLF